MPRKGSLQHPKINIENLYCLIIKGLKTSVVDSHKTGKEALVAAALGLRRQKTNKGKLQ